MNIRVLVKGIKPSHYLIEQIKSLIEESAKVYPLDPAHIKNVVIADDRYYGKVIKYFKKSGTYTNNNEYIAVGNTISKLNAGLYEHSIVIHPFPIEQIISGYSHSEDYTLWTPEEKIGRYIIYHELAHCSDNEQRKLSDADKTLAGIFRAKEIAAYYSEILVAEYSVSALSGFAVYDDSFDYEMKQTNETLRSSFLMVAKLKRQYHNNPDVLYELAYLLSGTLWLALIQYAKLIGYKTQNLSLASKQVTLWEKLNQSGRQAIIELEAGLTEAFKQYPNYSIDLDAWSYSIWNRLAKSMGYEFLEGVDSDGLQWYS